MALRLYPMGPETAEFQFTSMISDLRMNCGNDYASLVLAKSFRSPVYRYVMTYTPSAPISFDNESFAVRYSAHGFDVAGFYASFDSYLSPLAAIDIAFQNIMRQEVTSFMTTGNPYSSSWGQFPQQTALLSDSVNISSGYHTAECQFWLANGFLSYAWVN